MKKKILLASLLVGFIVVQFIRPNKQENKSVNKYDMIFANNPPNDVALLLKNACYDCHSNQTKSYWYSNIAPASWLIDKDVKHGREKLNFSDWELYTYDQKIDYAGEIMQEIFDAKMPLSAYTFMHSQAKLSKEDQNKITEWVNTLVQ